ncbi:MAG: efflux family protein [Chloroflexi bacterium]|nr:efflux family protein [Chloroflexota bacterium]
METPDLNPTEPQATEQSDKKSHRKKVWRLAWPAITEQLLNLTVGLNEVFLIGHISKEVSARVGYDSATALAATSLGQFFTWIGLAGYNGIGIATTALVARSVGAGEHDKAGNYARHGIIMAFIVGLFSAIVMYTMAPFMLFLLGAEGQLQQVGVLFVHTSALGMPFFAVLVAGNASMRGSGDTRTPLLIMLTINAINVAIAWLFINGQFGLPAMGVQGAALGAAVSWTVGAFLVLFLIFGRHKIGRIGNAFKVPFKLRLDWPTSNLILGQALPSSAEQWIFQIGIIFFSRMLVSLGTVTYAAHNAVVSIDSISFLPGIGLGMAVTVLVGQSLGAGKPEEAMRFTFTAYKMGLVFMTTMGLSFFFFPEFFLSLLIADPEVVKEAAPGLRIAGLFDPLVGTAFIFIGALRGAGDTRFPLYVRMFTSVVLRVSVGFLLIEVFHLGLVGARLAMGIDTIFMASLVVWRFRQGKWKTIWSNRDKKLAAAQQKVSGTQVTLPSPDHE